MWLNLFYLQATYMNMRICLWYCRSICQQWRNTQQGGEWSVNNNDISTPITGQGTLKRFLVYITRTTFKDNNCIININGVGWDYTKGNCKFLVTTRVFTDTHKKSRAEYSRRCCCIRRAFTRNTIPDRFCRCGIRADYSCINVTIQRRWTKFSCMTCLTCSDGRNSAFSNTLQGPSSR